MQIAWELPNDYIYYRKENPACNRLERALEDIYKCQRVVVTNSGMEAMTTAIEMFLPKGGKILIDENIYAETRLWLKLIGRYNVVATDLFSNFENADLVILDNPTVFQQWHDIEKICYNAHKCNAKVIVDNTIASFHYCNPLDYGADAVVESYTKYVTYDNSTIAGGIALKNVKNEKRLQAFLEWKGRAVHESTCNSVFHKLDTFGKRLDAITEKTQLIIQQLSVEYCGVGGVFIFPYEILFHCFSVCF